MAACDILTLTKRSQQMALPFSNKRDYQQGITIEQSTDSKFACKRPHACQQLSATTLAAFPDSRELRLVLVVLSWMSKNLGYAGVGLGGLHRSSGCQHCLPIK